MISQFSLHTVTSYCIHCEYAEKTHGFCPIRVVKFRCLGEDISKGCFSVTQAKMHLREELENRIRFETLISDISARFVKLSSDTVDSEINRALKQILDFFEVDRCGLLGVHEDKRFVWVTHVCYAEGIEPVSKEINLAELFPWSYDILTKKGLPVKVTRMTQLPSEAKQDCLSWSAMSVRSNLAIPLFSIHGIEHLMVIHSVHQERDWPEEYVQRLNLLGEIFINALERRDADRALTESEFRLNLAADAAGAGLWALNVLNGVFWLTDKTIDLFNFPRDDEITFDSFLEIVHPDDRERIRQTVDQSRQSKGEISTQYRIIRPDGSIRWMVSRGRLQFSESAETDLLMGVSIDITERKQTEEKLLASQQTLRVFTSKLLTIQEEERRRLARELHDDFTQRLVVLAMEMSKVEAAAKAANATFEPKLNHIKNQIIKLSTDIHDISRQLHPSIIDDLGLGRAIQSECTNFTRRAGIVIDYKQSNVPPTISRDISVALFRITQESLRNIQKHAGVKEAEVCLAGGSDHISLMIRDSGTGFDPSHIKQTHGLGLFSMQERVQFIQGIFSIDSAIGRGTQINVTVPLKETKSGQG